MRWTRVDPCQPCLGREKKNPGMLEPSAAKSARSDREASKREKRQHRPGRHAWKGHSVKAFCLLGASALREQDFVYKLIASLRLDGWSVSSIKRVPDGFDIDQPGRGSYVRREAGCSEVMLVGDRRLVLMQEFRASAEPSIASLLDRMNPVDVVMVEGFRNGVLPTVEVWLRSSGRTPRWLQGPNVFAIVSDEPVDTPIERFAPGDVGRLASYVALHLGLAT